MGINKLTEQEEKYLEMLSERILRKVWPELLKAHIEICPHGRRLRTIILISLGIGIGSGLLGGSASIALMRLLGG